MSRGVKVCGVCFGSGLRNVRGLLRRPEATGLVLRMQHGELKPGQCIHPLLPLLADTPKQMHLLKSCLAANFVAGAAWRCWALQHSLPVVQSCLALGGQTMLRCGRVPEGHCMQ